MLRTQDASTSTPIPPRTASKRSRILIITAVCCLVLVIVCFLPLSPSHTTYTGRYSIPAEADYRRQLQAETVRSDAQFMVELLEETHPYFLEEVDAAYLQARQDYLDAANETMSLNRFFFLTNRYLASLGDGHTALGRYYSEVLAPNWLWQDDALVIADSDDHPKQRRIVEIGGVPVEEVARFIDSCYPAETEFARIRNISTYSRVRSVLEDCGVLCNGNYVYLKTEEAGKISESKAKFYTAKDTPLNRLLTTFFAVATPKEFELSLIENDSIAYLQTRKCVLGPAHSEAMAQLKEAVDRGIDKVIVDVRHNGGGNSAVWNSLFEIMGMQPGSSGSLIRLSPLAREQKPQMIREVMQGHPDCELYAAAYDERYSRPAESVYSAPSNEVVQNPAVELIILAGEGTFSAGMDLVTSAHDGQLATVIGNGIRNTPSSYTDIVEFQLPGSLLAGQMSHKKKIRPNPALDEVGDIGLDIEIPLGEDALPVAIALLQEGEQR